MRLLRRAIYALLAVLLLFGGFVTWLATTTPDVRAAPEWDRLADMPEPRGEAGAGVAARIEDCTDADITTCSADPVRLIVAGGLAGAGRTVKTVSVYSPEGDSWSTGPDLPEARHHPGAAGSGGVLYVTGGSETATSWDPRDDLWELAPDSATWKIGPAMPEPRMGHAMVAIDAKLYIVGGRGPSSNVLIYDTRERTWSLGAQMPRQRDHLAAAVLDTKIYALGGRHDTVTPRVDIYDTVTDAWTEGPALPIPMSGMAAAALADGIHVVGGEEPATIGGRVIDAHYVLKPGATTWANAPLPIVATHGSAYAIMRDSLVIAGGARRQGALSPLGWTGITEAYSLPSS